MTDLARRIVKMTIGRILTTTAFVFAVVGQGFRFCPHHDSLASAAHDHGAQTSSYSVPIDGSVADGPLGNAEGGACLCIDGCDLGSESHPHFATEASWNRSSAPRLLVLAWQSEADVSEPTRHLIPFAQPPPHGVGS